MEQGSQQSGVVNMTRAMEALSPMLNNPRMTIMKIEALVAVTTALLFLQLILGSCKRCCRWQNALVSLGLSACNSLLFPLVFYTLSVMQDSPIKNAMYPVWGVSLLMAAGGTITVKQYHFDKPDIKTYLHFVAADIPRYAFYFVMLSLLVSTGSFKDAWGFRTRPSGHKSHASSTCTGALLLVIYATKVFDLSLSYNLYFWDIKVAEWTNDHANDHPDDTDPKTMKGYNYLITYPSFFIGAISKRLEGEVNNCLGVTTVDQIWGSCGDSGHGVTLKDVSLSFALFQLLMRRYYGFFCAEAKLKKTQDLVFKGLLLLEESGYTRVFRIIETELQFCYDYLNTKYRSIWCHGVIHFPLFLTRIILIFVVLVYAIKDSLILETSDPIIQVETTRGDKIITVLVLVTALVIELLQVVIYLASDWFKVSLACMYVKGKPNAFREKIIGFFSRSTNLAGRRNMIDQSVISYDERGFLWNIMKKRAPDTVKTAIARSLLSTSDKLTNGGSSLSRNGMFERYSWTLKDHHQVEIMSIWHIATDYCDHALPDGQTSGTNRDDREVAVTLSRYCTYLVRLVGELLPYHPADTEEFITKVVTEVEEAVKEKRKEILASSAPSERYRKIMECLEGTGGEEDDPKIFKKGLKLGKQLECMTDPDGVQRWKVMADFWAETIIYVAPSHVTAKEHLARLEDGGEFLTIIWALLSHAGILNLDRDKDQGAMPAQPTRETV